MALRNLQKVPMRHPIPAAVCLALLVPGAATAAQGQALGACVTRAASEFGFNGYVHLRRGDAIIESAFGASDAAAQMPITNGTRFNIGSAAKMFSAIAIGLLAERNKIALDAPIGRYLPGLAPQFASITIEQLLHHTSGLGDYFRPENAAAIDAARTATDLLPLVWATPPAFAPGSSTAYSNSGYVVLGAIIESVSGLTYAEFIGREIIAPLGMTNTRMDGEGGAEAMTRMSPGGMLEHPRPSPMRAGRASPAGGIFSTASDLSRLLAALERGQLVKPATLRALFRPRSQGPARIGHNGGAPGVNAEIWLYPDSLWQLIVLSNYDPPGATRMAGVLEAAMLATDTDAACTAAIAAPPPPMPVRRR